MHSSAKYPVVNLQLYSSSKDPVFTCNRHTANGIMSFHFLCGNTGWCSNKGPRSEMKGFQLLGGLSVAWPLAVFHPQLTLGRKGSPTLITARNQLKWALESLENARGRKWSCWGPPITTHLSSTLLNVLTCGKSSEVRLQSLFSDTICLSSEIARGDFCYLLARMKEKKSNGEIWAFKVAAGRQILRLIERWGDI